jgi:hypothetical protein
MPVAEKLVDLTRCPGVRAATLPTFRIQLNRNNELLLLERWQSSVRLQTDDRSLADFVVDHCRSALRSLQSCDGIALLETKLKGVSVQVRTSAGHEARRVVNFKKGTVTDVPSDHKHYAWPSAGGMFLSPNLPLVNVGSLDKPLYLPMEVCKICEDQPLHGPRDIRLNCLVNSMNRQIASRDLSNAPEHGSIVFHQITNKRDDELQGRLVKAFDNITPNLLFIQAGSTSIGNNRWSKLRHAIEDRLQQSFKDSAKCNDRLITSDSPDSLGDFTPLQYLRYVPGNDPSASWTRQLNDFVTAHPFTKGKTVAVVWLEPEQDCNKMYKAIKRACDTNSGVQTIFVKRETFESRVHTASMTLDVVEHAATDICRRICLKNAAMLTTRTKHAETSKLVIAMHVSQLSSALQPAGTTSGRQDQSEIYLVTLVSRDHASSEHYHTEQGLFSKPQVLLGRHVMLLKAFLKVMPNLTPDKVTILRSGDMPICGEGTDASLDDFDLTDSASFSEVGKSSTVPEITVPRVQSPAQQSQVTVEIGAITEVFQNASPGVFTYVTLTEDSTLMSRVDPGAYLSRRPLDNPPAMLFLKNETSMDSESFCLKVQQIPRVRPQDRSGDEGGEKAPETRPGAITATFHHSQAGDDGPQELKASSIKSISGGPNGSIRKASRVASHFDPKDLFTALPFRQHGSEPTTPKFEPVTPSRSVAIKTETPSEDAIGSGLPFDTFRATTVSQQPHASHSAFSSMIVRDENNATDEGIELLAAIWKDEGLGLYSTKWPIPTHLARLAAKRAMVHIRVEDWQHVSQNDTAPYSLPPVHENVRDTLYYL